MSDGTRTRDRLDHNQELYQLSYAHHGDLRLTWYAGFVRGGRAVRDRDDPMAEAGETDKGKEKLDKIVNW